MINVLAASVVGIFWRSLSGNPWFAIGGDRRLRPAATGCCSFLASAASRSFIEEFPNAVDVIVRGVKSGLPLGDCIRIIASEAAEPVRSPNSARSSRRRPSASAWPRRRPCPNGSRPEANFFGIVIEIQSKSGGNLVRSSGQPVRVLRDRRKMRGKVQAMSMEAKASAGIIAALPFIVVTLVYVTSPEYILLLFTTDTGKLVAHHLRLLDGDRHGRDEENDQLRHLRTGPCGGELITITFSIPQFMGSALIAWPLARRSSPLRCRCSIATIQDAHEIGGDRARERIRQRERDASWARQGLAARRSARRAQELHEADGRDCSI
jgi:hypothetical protein